MKNCCLVIFPVEQSRINTFSNILMITKRISDKLHIISEETSYELIKNDKDICFYDIKHDTKLNLALRVLNYSFLQLKISYYIFKIRNNVDFILLFIGGEGLILPSLTARILKKDLIILLAGNPAKVSKANNDPLSKIIGLLSIINLKISSKIVLYSKSVVKERGLDKFKEKIFIGGEHFLDLENFKIKKKYETRKLIGYVGKFGELKGIMNLLEAIPKLLEYDKDFTFIFIGDGPLKKEIVQFIKKKKLADNVIVKGWIKHDDLPAYLNELKLLVIPSYTEGLPNIILEAMACGTPALSSDVGAIPDILKDGENGFLLKDNSSTSIKEGIIRAINYSNLDEVSINARKFVEKEYNYKNILKIWEEILNQ